MKTLPALVCSFCVITLGFAQTAPVAPAPTTETESVPTPAPKPKAPPVRITPPAVKTPSEQAAAAKKAEAAKKDKSAKKAEEEKEEPKIPGVVVARGPKGFMGVEMVGGNFKITFYDMKRKKIAPDVLRAVLRWDPKYKVGQERVVLNPDGDGKSLSSPKAIRPPHTFKLFITLLKEDSEAPEPVGETHVIDFRA